MHMQRSNKMTAQQPPALRQSEKQRVSMTLRCGGFYLSVIADKQDDRNVNMMLKICEQALS